MPYRKEVQVAQAGSTTSVSSLEVLIQENIEADNVPGLSVAVVKGNRFVWKRGFGFADLATSTLATPSTSSGRL